MSETYRLIKTEENIWRIETDIVRSWLFVGEQKALLIDTTEQSGDLDAVVRSVTDLPVMLVITHADGDHIAANDRFETAYMHPEEFELYRKGAGEGFAKPAPLTEGEKIDLGGRTFEVLHLPGHTAGSIALLDHENRILVCGDIISNSHVFLFGEYRDVPTFRKTLLRCKDLSPAFDRIYTSHGDFCVGIEQIENELLCLDEYLAGKLTPEEPCFEFPIPAKMYRSHNAGFFI